MGKIKNFLLENFTLSKNGNKISQKNKPYIKISDEIREEYLILKASVGYLNCRDSKQIGETETIINLLSLSDIYNLLQRKADNLQNVNKILKRNGKGIYSFEDFIRGRIGEIYGEIGSKKIIEKILENIRGLESYDISTINRIMYKEYTLEKYINAMNHSNYFFYFTKNKQKIVKGEFDFAYQLNYQYKNTLQKILFIGETKTGKISINKNILRNNLQILSQFPYDAIVYCITVPQEKYFDKDTKAISKYIKSLYTQIYSSRKKGYNKNLEKVHIIPTIFISYSNTTNYFLNLGKKVAYKILELFRNNNIEVFVKIGIYNNDSNCIKPDKKDTFFMINIPCEIIRKDARRLNIRKFEEKYGKNIYTVVSNH